MEKIKDKLFDLCPAWLYRLYNWVRYRPRWIKRWFKRANGGLPDCDCWNFNITLAETIEQGLSYLLYHGRTAGWGMPNKLPQQERSDLVYIKDTMSNFVDDYYNRGAMSIIEFEKAQNNLGKAFKLLGEYIWTLWD